MTTVRRPARRHPRRRVAAPLPARPARASTRSAPRPARPRLATRSIKTTAKAWAIDTAIRDGRPDHAGGRRHPRQGALAVRQGDAPGSRPIRPCRRSPPSASTPTSSSTAVDGAARVSRVQIASVATAFPSGRAALATKLHDVRDAVAAGATEIDMVIDRGAFLAGHYLQVFDEIVATKAGLRRRPPQGDPRDRRAGDPRQRPPRVLAGAARRRRLHQDLDRQDHPGGDPAGRAGDAARRCATSPTLTGELRGVKLAGGIRTSKEAVRYLVMVNEVAGDAVARPATCSGSARPACSTTCCSSGTSWRPAATTAPTT